MVNGINPIKDFFFKKGGDVVANIMEKADGLFSNKEEMAEKKNELEKIISDGMVSVLELHYSEMNNARNREIEISKSENATWIQKSIVPIIAIGTLMLSFALFFVFNFTNYVDPAKREVVAQMQGNLNGFCFMILSYFFGAMHFKNKKDGN